MLEITIGHIFKWSCMMRNSPSRATAVTPQETLPEFTRLEQALVNKLEDIQRNLNNKLNEISVDAHIEISELTKNRIRHILFDVQRTLGIIARTYVNSNRLSNFYHDVNQFVRMVDEMEMMFCQTLKNSAQKKEAAEEDAILLDTVASNLDTLTEKTAEELFSEFSTDNRNNLLADHSDMIRQIERVGDLSGAIYAASQLVDKNAQEPVFLVRFFDARRMVSEAIEKIHHVIYHRDEPSNQTEPRRRARVTTPASKDERCYEFGLISLCSEIKKQMRALLVKNNEAQAKRIKILKMICSLANRMPESLSSTDSSSSYTSSESSNSGASSDSSGDDSSRASSLTSSGLFSRSRSPEPRNPNQSASSAARPG